MTYYARTRRPWEAYTFTRSGVPVTIVGDRYTTLTDPEHTTLAARLAANPLLPRIDFTNVPPTDAPIDTGGGGAPVLTYSRVLVADGTPETFVPPPGLAVDTVVYFRQPA